MIEMVKVLKMFARTFGVPLSFGALLSGLTLGLGTRRGVFRYPWVITKLLLIVSVILVGALIIGPAWPRRLNAAWIPPRASSRRPHTTCSRWPSRPRLPYSSREDRFAQGLVQLRRK